MRDRKFDVMLDVVAPLTGAVVALFMALGFLKLIGCP